MGLVGYSDSEGSDDEQKQHQPASKQAPAKSSKPSFQKVVNKSKPNKIRVSLLGAAATEDNDVSEDGPPAKKARTAGGLGGFNSFLPAPKNAAAQTAPTTSGVARATGIGRGISLKTGAAPAFSREQPSAYDADGTLRAEASAPLPVVEEVKLVGKPMAFKPLSVSRKPRKKGAASSASPKTTSSSSNTPVAAADSQQPASTPPVKQKTSLFSTSADDTPFSNIAPVPEATHYTPILLEDDEEPNEPDHIAAETQQPPQQPPPSQATDLSTLATTLNLSAAERRQLFGRNGPTNAQVAQFNLAAEYQSNRALAESADAAPAHNPVRSIAGGKHSLQQLINNAQSQKDALEESFARGKGNKKEAGSRYGW